MNSRIPTANSWTRPAGQQVSQAKQQVAHAHRQIQVRQNLQAVKQGIEMRQPPVSAFGPAASHVMRHMPPIRLPSLPQPRAPRYRPRPPMVTNYAKHAKLLSRQLREANQQIRGLSEKLHTLVKDGPHTMGPKLHEVRGQLREAEMSRQTVNQKLQALKAKFKQQWAENSPFVSMKRG